MAMSRKRCFAIALAALTGLNMIACGSKPDSASTTPQDTTETLPKRKIVLTGGGAELFGIETMIEKVLGVSVVKPEAPIDAVAKGLSRIHSVIPKIHGSNGKNITDKLSKFYETKKNNLK